jgi:subtilisin family serine protease
MTQTPNDPYFVNQHALAFMQVPEAWAVTTGSSSVEMAQFDTGVQSHPDLGINVVLDNLPIYSAFGTWAAGIVAATTDNGIGIAGICQHLTFRVYRTIWSEEHLAESFALAQATGAKIGVTGYALAGWHSRPEFDRTLSLWSNSGQRILICPAGDVYSGGQRVKGKNDTRLLVVGACNTDGQRAAGGALTVVRQNLEGFAGNTDGQRAIYSNLGSTVDLWAPGHATVTNIDGGYAASDTTKIAAAHVAGVAGLVASANPSLTGAEIQSILISTATHMACGPVVNALAAVQAA